jgi:hypothetical protein
MTPSGIEPATLRLVAQGPNNLRHRVKFVYEMVSKMKRVNQEADFTML